MANDNLSMKLLINGPSQKVIFAEAGKEVVDFLFSLLAMPLGTVVKLLKEGNMVGCVGSLYHSLQALEDPYLQCKLSKDALLNPTVASSSIPQSMLLPASTSAAQVAEATKIYRCNYACNSACYQYYTEVSGTVCPNTSCRNLMTIQATLVGIKPAHGTANVSVGSEGKIGCVKGVVTYTIMDDLTVSPMSSISSITLLNKFKVKDLSSLEEKIAILDLEKGLELLKASMESKTVLTDIFIGKARRA